MYRAKGECVCWTLWTPPPAQSSGSARSDLGQASMFVEHGLTMTAPFMLKGGS